MVYIGYLRNDERPWILAVAEDQDLLFQAPLANVISRETYQLSSMSDSFTPVAASESKATFMTSIGLQAGNTDHERLYKRMKEDAVNAYRRVVRERQAMSPDDEQQNTTRPRYAYTQIDKDIIKDAIVSIYEQASSETKQFYDRGVDPNGEGNWVIRWLLWHTFRYRDSRNKRPSTAYSPEESTSSAPLSTVYATNNNSGGEYNATDSGNPTQIPTSSSSSSGGNGRSSLPYDPVRSL